MASQRVASCSSVQVSCLVALMMLALLVGDAAAVSYTLRASDSIAGASGQSQGFAVAMSSNGLVSLSTSNSASYAPLLAVAASPGARTAKTSLSLPSPCNSWFLSAAVSSSGNMFAVVCYDTLSNAAYAAVYQTSSPSTPFAMLPHSDVPTLSEDGSTLVTVGYPFGSTVSVFKLSMGAYVAQQVITTSFGANLVAIAPDASALAVSDQVTKTSIHGWISSTSQFVIAPSMPLSVACHSLAVSSKSPSGATTIACADNLQSTSPIFSLVNAMGSLSVITQATISGGYRLTVAITPDGSIVAISNDFSSTTIHSATTGSMIATISEAANSLAISSDAATVLVADPNFNSGAGRAVWYDSLVAPTITLQPMSVSVTAPAAATFTAKATGYAIVQWSFTGSSTRRRSVLGGVIPGATSTSFTTNPTTSAFNGNTYSATFTSAAGVSTTTLAATLTVASSSASALSSDSLMTTVRPKTHRTQFNTSCQGFGGFPFGGPQFVACVGGADHRGSVGQCERLTKPPTALSHADLGRTPTLPSLTSSRSLSSLAGTPDAGRNLARSVATVPAAQGAHINWHYHQIGTCCSAMEIVGSPTLLIQRGLHIFDETFHSSSFGFDGPVHSYKWNALD